MEKLKLTYQIKAEELMEGYDLYYKAFRQKFTYIKAAIFLIPLLLFLQQVWMDPYYTLGWVCIIICIGAIYCILAMPKLERRNTERALSAIKDDSYQLVLTDENLSVSTIIPEEDEKYLDVNSDGTLRPLPEIRPTVVGFKEKSYRCVETEKIFSVMTKEVSLVIPKNNLSVYEKETLRDSLKPSEK